MIKTLAGINKTTSFVNVNDYLDYVTPKFVLNKHNIYYPACEDEIKFFSLIVSSKTSYFYGTFIDSATRIGHSDFFNKMKGCSGRVENEIKYPANYTNRDSLFYKVKIVNAISKKRFFPNRKRNIVFVFSIKQGILNRRELKKLQNEYNDTSKYKLVMISLDDICNL